MGFGEVGLDPSPGTNFLKVMLPVKLEILVQARILRII